MKQPQKLKLSSFITSIFVYLYIIILYIGNYNIHLIGYNNNMDLNNELVLLKTFITNNAVLIRILCLAILLILIVYLFLRRYWINIISFLTLFIQSMSLPTIYAPHKIIFILLLFISLSFSWLLTSELIYFIRDNVSFVSNYFSLILKVLTIFSILTTTYFKFNFMIRCFNAFIRGVPFFTKEFSLNYTDSLIKQCIIYYVMNAILLFITFNVILRIDNYVLAYDIMLGKLSFIYTSLLSGISAIFYMLYIYNYPYSYNNKRYPTVSIMLFQFVLTLLPVLFVFHYIVSSTSSIITYNSIVIIKNNISDSLLKLFYKLFNVIECQPDSDNIKGKIGSQKLEVSGNNQISGTETPIDQVLKVTDNNVFKQGPTITTTNAEASSSLSNTTTDNSGLAYQQLQEKVVINFDQSTTLNATNINLISVTPQPSSNISGDIISRPGSSASVNSSTSNISIETIRPKRRESFACDKSTFLNIFERQLGIKWFDKIIDNFNTLGFFTNYNFLYEIFINKKISPSHFNYFTEDLIRRALVRDNNFNKSPLECLLLLDNIDKYNNLESFLKNVWIYLNGRYSIYNYDLRKHYIIKGHSVIELFIELSNKIKNDTLNFEDLSFLEKSHSELLNKYNFLYNLKETSNTNDILNYIIKSHFINSTCQPNILYFHNTLDLNYGYVKCFSISRTYPFVNLITNNNMDNTSLYLCDNLHKLNDCIHIKSRDLERAIYRILENINNTQQLNRYYKLFSNPNYITAYNDLYNLIFSSTTGDNSNLANIFEFWNGYLKTYYHLLELNDTLKNHISHNYTIEGLNTTMEQNNISKSPAEKVLFRIGSKQFDVNNNIIITQNYPNDHLKEVNSKLVLKYFPDLMFNTPNIDNIDDNIDNDIDDITGNGKDVTDIKGKDVVSPKSVNTDIYINKPLPPLPDTNNNSN